VASRARPRWLDDRVPSKNWRALLTRRKPADVPQHGHPKLAHRVKVLETSSRRVRRRVAALEEGLQEQRRLNLRVAELTDVVTELVGAAARGEDEFRRVLSQLDPAGAGEPDQRHDG
jgi:hypothetical protein